MPNGQTTGPGIDTASTSATRKGPGERIIPRKCAGSPFLSQANAQTGHDTLLHLGHCRGRLPRSAISGSLVGTNKQKEHDDNA